MDKIVLVLTLVCGFLLGVVAAPWIRPQTTEPAKSDAPAPVVPAAAALPEVPASLPPPPSREAEEPEMALKGVFLVPEEAKSVALISTGEGQAQPYRLEQKLPNGYVLQSIQKNSVEVSKDGNNVTLPLIRASRDSSADSETPGLLPAVEDSAIAPEPQAEPAGATRAEEKPASAPVTPAAEGQVVDG